MLLMLMALARDRVREDPIKRSSSKRHFMARVQKMSGQGWINGLAGLRQVESNPLNAASTDWYSHHTGSMLGTSCQQYQLNQQRNIAIHEQQQRWHAQSTLDAMELWAPIYTSMSNSTVTATEAIARQGPEQHSSNTLRPGVLYSDPAAEQQITLTRLNAGSRL